MTTSLTADVLQDELAVSVARVLAAANRKAEESGIDLVQSLISISQRGVDQDWVWRVNYSPKNYIGRRGGDLIIDVDPNSAAVTQVLRGQ